MTVPSGSRTQTAIPAGPGRPREGERTRGAVDALQTKIAVDVQNLDPRRYHEQLQENIAGMPDASGCDAAFLALIRHDGSVIETVLAAGSVFAACNPEPITGEALQDWPWLSKRLGHLRVIDIADTDSGPAAARAEMQRLAQLHIGSALIIGFCIDDEIAGFLAVVNERPVEAWDASLHLLLKLIGASLASGIERMRTVDILAEVEERNELVSLTANDGIWDFNGETKRIDLSRRWKTMLGYDAEQSDVLPDWYRLVHPDDMARVQAKMREHLEGKTEFFESVHRMRHQNGEWRWMTSRAKARQDDRGRLIRLLGVEVDITERKLYEEALFREKESAQITLRSIGDGVITTDAECNVEYINPVAEELTGWKVDDASGREVDQIFKGFHEETCEPLENPLAVAIRRSRSIKSVRPTLLIRRDGNELYIESTASPIRDGDGNVTGGVLVFHDVSEARELNRRLSYHASHDIQSARIRVTAGAGVEERESQGGVVCTLLSRSRPVQDRQRLLRSQCGRRIAWTTGCASQIEDSLARHAGEVGRRRIRHPPGKLYPGRGDADRRSAAHGDRGFQVYVGRPQFPARREYRCRPDYRGE
jgi:PAS domain S-box-containing protein